MIQKACLQSQRTRYLCRCFITATQNTVDNVLESLNHKQLIVGTGREESNFQRRSNQLSTYSLFSCINKDNKLQLISNECSNNKEMDRSVGCMYGMAIGDAVGAPLEFIDATKSLIYPSAKMVFFQSSKSYFDLNNQLYHNELNEMGLERGQWTDDCSMGLCIADSLIINEKYDGSDIRTRYWNWWFNGYTTSNKAQAFGLGGNISESIYSLKYNEIPDEIYIVQHDRDDSGNGSIMRLAPIPIFFSHSDMDDILYYAEQSSLTTHPGYRAAESCKLMSYIIVKAIHNESEENIQTFLDRVVTEYKENVIVKELEILSKSLDDKDIERKVEAKQLILRLMDSNEDNESNEVCWNWRNKYGDIGIDVAMKNRGKIYNGYPNDPTYFGSYCLDGLSMALHGVYHSESIGGAITNAVNLLGDADSTGSIAGQIAGAFYGFNSSLEKDKAERCLLDNVLKWDDCDIGVRAVLLCELGRRHAISHKK